MAKLFKFQSQKAGIMQLVRKLIHVLIGLLHNLIFQSHRVIKPVEGVKFPDGRTASCRWLTATTSFFTQCKVCGDIDIHERGLKAAYNLIAHDNPQAST